MKKILVIVGVLVAAGALLWYLNSNGSEVGGYRFVSIERGNLESVVTSTGTLDAVTTVEVGTQVSGIVSEILVDFNDEVVEGEVIAVLDKTLLEIAVQEAEANLERNEAQLRHCEREHQRLQSLYAQDVLAEVELNQALYDLEVARANAKSAEAGLEAAKRNLAYATIYAPISGTVVERDVDVGQTVAASLASPRLFLIANDLSRMQILVSVDESDIGLIEEGQTARFTVQAHPDGSFEGTVRQVRLQSTTMENVVNYIVVVDVENREGLLLPGMTATVEFLIETATDVLKVPNAALRFRPTEEMIEELHGDRALGPDAESGASQQFRPSTSDLPDQGARPEDLSLLFSLDERGNLVTLPVRVGLTDGQSTEIQGPDLSEGMQIIAGVMSASGGSSANPFQSQQQTQRMGPPGPGF